MSSVLVVEDDQMFAKAVGRDLSEQGFTVAVSHRVPEALARLRSGGIDVLLTDLQLEADDGIQLLEMLPEVSPRTRAVLMSGLATARDYQRAIELGAVRVLCKPFTPAELIQCVRQAIECETGFRGSVHGLSLVVMLQMFNYGRRSVSIAVAGESPGRLHLRDGQIVHVEHRGQVGEAALQSLLAMPGGTLTTSALPAAIATSVTRDFRQVLLDALRTMDEAAASGGEELVLDLGEEPPAPPAAPATGPMIQRLQQIDGYLAVCLAYCRDGAVIAHDGSPDLRPLAPASAQVMRQIERTVSELGLDDEPEDLLVTGTRQYHLLRGLHLRMPAFVHLVLDRDLTNPAMAKLALTQATRSLEP